MSFCFDETVVERWVENPYGQYFCGYDFLQHERPCDPTSLTRWRKHVGDKLDTLLEETIWVAQETRALKRTAIKHVNVDTTVQEKAIAFPTDARLYQKMRVKLVRKAKKQGIRLHAVIGDQSSGLKSRPGNYSFTPVVLRSSLQVIGYCKFREGKATGRNASESVLASLTYWGC